MQQHLRDSSEWHEHKGHAVKPQGPGTYFDYCRVIAEKLNESSGEEDDSQTDDENDGFGKDNRVKETGPDPVIILYCFCRLSSIIINLEKG